MEQGIGRLLSDADRGQWPCGAVRSAFSIGGGHVLTAWHCIRDLGGASTRLWLRLQSDGPAAFVDIGLIYAAHRPELDVALLVVDDEAEVVDGHTLSPDDARRVLDAVALPLGAEVAAHDRVRLGGHPLLNPAHFCVMLSGVVTSVAARIGERDMIRVHSQELAARHPESPHGLSGGPLLRRDANGAERVVGVMSVFPPASDGAALGGVVLYTRVEDLVPVFPVVGEALRGAGSPRRDPRGPHPQGSDLGVPTLSPDVVEAYRPILVAAAPGGLPAWWTADELDRLHKEVAADIPSQVGDVVQVLGQAVRAKAVFLALGAERLELGTLQAVYRRETGVWPAGNSVDALLVAAADIALAERRAATAPPLCALARFVLGTAARLGVPQDSPPLTAWIGSLGHQVADARQHYDLRRDSSAWLLVDFGDEPVAGAPIWPAALRWLRCAAGEEDMGGEVTCERSAEGLRAALRRLFRVVPPARPLLVDLALPHTLIAEGIEHWPILEVDDDLESLNADHYPRLRWSRRRRDITLYNRLLDRTACAAWARHPATLPEDIVADPISLRQWIRSDTTRACVVGGLGRRLDNDPLRVLLREGCGFVVWFPAAVSADHAQRITAATDQVPIPARRSVLPDELPPFPDQRPAVIWDDPLGRAAFPLPPLLIPESP